MELKVYLRMLLMNRDDVSWKVYYKCITFSVYQLINDRQKKLQSIKAKDMFEVVWKPQHYYIP